MAANWYQLCDSAAASLRALALPHGLNRKLLTASRAHGVLQLLFVGYYLEYLFAYDNPWINAAWILVMVIVADFATVDRSDLRQKASVLVPIFGATFLGIGLIDLYFLEVVIQLPKLLAAQYTIPITGMVLGNCLRSNVIGINAFYYSLDEHKERYQFYLASGASRAEALRTVYQPSAAEVGQPYAGLDGDDRTGIAAGHDDGTDPERQLSAYCY
ncbi:MAG: ABC transporter permease [Fodinibius sp.]|nr:ABC transporter permease [Fodinibius sp.]